MSRYVNCVLTDLPLKGGKASLEVPNVQPVPMLTQYLNQCIIEVKRVFHQLLPCIGIIHESICVFRALWKTRFFGF